MEKGKIVFGYKGDKPHYGIPNPALHITLHGISQVDIGTPKGKLTIADCATDVISERKKIIDGIILYRENRK